MGRRSTGRLGGDATGLWRRHCSRRFRLLLLLRNKREARLLRLHFRSDDQKLVADQQKDRQTNGNKHIAIVVHQIPIAVEQDRSRRNPRATLWDGSATVGGWPAPDLLQVHVS